MVGGSDLLQRAHSETGNGVTLARLVPYGYKGEPNPHYPSPSVIFHTMFAEGRLVYPGSLSQARKICSSDTFSVDTP